MGNPIFHDSSDYLIIVCTSLGRKHVNNLRGEMCLWSGDERNPTPEQVEQFGAKEWNIGFGGLAREIQDEWETYREKERGEAITAVTLYELKGVYEEGDSYDGPIAYRVAKMLVYYPPFIVD